MEDGRNNAAVERRLKEAMRNDRARLQIGRISPFGLMELSRQRLRPSLMEINFEKCPHCAGMGFVRSVDSAALAILRMIEEEGIKQGSAELVLHLPTKIALYILNQKRPALNEIERRYGLQVLMHSDDALVPPDYKLERTRTNSERTTPILNADQIYAEGDTGPFPPPLSETASAAEGEGGDQNRGDGRRRGRYGFGRGRNRNQQGGGHQPHEQQPQRQPALATPGDQPVADGETNGNVVEPVFEGNDNIGNAAPPSFDGGGDPAQQDQQRRGRRGGRGRRSGGERPGGGFGGGGSGSGGGGGGSRRDGNSQQRPYEQRPRNNWNRPYDNPVAAAESVPAAIPASIDELDTTPREERQAQQFRASQTPMETPRSQSSAPTATPRAEPRQSISSVPYEIVENADKPKGGWWKKLTGQ